MRMDEFLKESGEIPDSVVSLMRQIRERTEKKLDEADSKAEMADDPRFKVIVDTVHEDAVSGLVAFGVLGTIVSQAAKKERSHRGGFGMDASVDRIQEACSLMLQFLAAVDDFAAQEDKYEIRESDPAFA